MRDIDGEWDKTSRYHVHKTVWMHDFFFKERFDASTIEEEQIKKAEECMTVFEVQS